MSFPFFYFPAPGSPSPVHIHLKANLKVDTKVDIQKGEIPMISRGRYRGVIDQEYMNGIRSVISFAGKEVMVVYSLWGHVDVMLKSFGIVVGSQNKY